MVSAPRLHTSAAHPPAGDGNQAMAEMMGKEYW